MEANRNSLFIITNYYYYPKYLKPLEHIRKVMKTFYTVGFQENYPSRDTVPLNRYGRGEGSQGAVQQGL